MRRTTMRIAVLAAAAVVAASTATVVALQTAGPAAAGTVASLIEVHQADAGLTDLWRHNVSEGFTTNFGGSTDIGPGVNPSVAYRGAYSIEVHQTSDSPTSSLVWRIGFSFNFDPKAYATGSNPTVAVNSHGQVVEVHDDGSGNMAYLVGQIIGGNMKWGNVHVAGVGAPEAVAVNDAGIVVAAYNAPEGTRHRMGRLVGTGSTDASTFDVNWNISERTIVGPNASIAMLQGFIVEAYEGPNSDLYARVGLAGANGIAWQPGARYDSGFNPSVAVDTNFKLVEVHQESVGTGHLWSHTGTVIGGTGAPRGITWSGPSFYDNGLNPVISG